MTDDAKQKAIDLYVSGKTVAEVARELGLKDGLVWNWVDRAGVRRESKRSRHMDAAMTDYLDGNPVTEIAERYKVSVSTVQAWASKRGLTGKGGRHAQIASNRASAILLYTQGKRYSEIAEILKLAPGTVSRWIEDEGVTDAGGAVLQDRQDAEVAVRLYTEKNSTIEGIAAHLGRGVNTVSGWLREANVEIKSSIERRSSEEQAMYGRLGVAAKAAKAGPPEKRICAHCEGTFELPPGKRTSRQKYCSRECSQLGRRHPDKRVKATCEKCSKEFERFASYKGANRFCSAGCRDKSQKGIQWRFEGNVLDSGYEAMFVGLCGLYGIRCERFDREGGVNWVDDRWYAPDFLVTVANRSVVVEIKGRVRDNDEAKWAAFREAKDVPLVVLQQADLMPPPQSREALLELLGLSG